MEQTNLTLPQMLPDFKGRTAVVTGAGQGIGRCVALSFAAAGAHVFLADRDEDGGRESLGLIRSRACVRFVPTDVSDEQRCCPDAGGISKGRDRLSGQQRAIANAGAPRVKRGCGCV